MTPRRTPRTSDSSRESAPPNKSSLDDDDLWKPIVIDLDGEGHVVGFEFSMRRSCSPRSS